MSGVRHAAMVLHGLGEADREWTLSRLPQERASELRSLLEELHELGMPVDPDLIKQAVHRSEPLAPPESPAQSKAGQVNAAIDGARADRMLSLLRGEPDRLVALVVSSSGWSWRQSFLAHLGPHRAERIRDMGLSMRAPSALRAAVLQALAERLQHGSDEHTGGEASGAARRWSLAGLRRRMAQGVPAWRR